MLISSRDSGATGIGRRPIRSWPQRCSRSTTAMPHARTVPSSESTAGAGTRDVRRHSAPRRSRGARRQCRGGALRVFSRHRRSSTRTHSGCRGRQVFQSGSVLITAASASVTVSPGNGDRPGEHFVQHTAERPDVAARSSAAYPRPARGSCKRPCRAPPCRVAGTSVIGRRLVAGDVALGGISCLGKAEVEHLHRAVGPHLDIRGLQVAVNDPLLVRGFERGGDLTRDRQRFVERIGPRREPMASGRRPR